MDFGSIALTVTLPLLLAVKQFVSHPASPKKPGSRARGRKSDKTALLQFCPKKVRVKIIPEEYILTCTMTIVIYFITS